MKKLLLTLSFFIASCASLQISTLHYDPIYGPDNNEIKVDVLTTDWDVFRKFEIDSDFSEHVWVIDGYSMRDGWMEGDWWLEVEAFDQSGKSISLKSIL